MERDQQLAHDPGRCLDAMAELQRAWPGHGSGGGSAHVQRHAVKAMPGYSLLMQAAARHAPSLDMQQLLAVAHNLQAMGGERGSSGSGAAADEGRLLHALAAACAARLQERRQGLPSPALADSTQDQRPAVLLLDARAGVELLALLLKLDPGSASASLSEAVAGTAAAASLPEHADDGVLCTLVWALGKLPRMQQAAPAARQVVQRLLRRLSAPGLIAGLPPMRLSKLLYGLGKLDQPLPPALLAAACDAAAAACSSSGSSTSGCSPQAVANMSWAISRMHRASRSAPPSTSAPTAAAAEAAGREAVDGDGPDAGTSAHVRRALDALAHAAVHMVPDFSPQELANLLGALANEGMCMHHPQLLAACERHLLAAMLGQEAAAVPAPQKPGTGDTNGGASTAAPGSATVPPPLPSAQRQQRQQQQMSAKDWSEVMYAFASASSAATDAGGYLPLSGEERHPDTHSGESPAPVRGIGGSISVYAPAPAFLDAASVRCAQLLPRATPYQVATMAWAFASLRHLPHALVAEVVALMQEQEQGEGQRQREQQPCDLQAPQSARAASGTGARRRHAAVRHQAGRARGRRRGAADGDAAVVPGFVPRTLVASLEPAQLAQLLWALAKLGAEVPQRALSCAAAALQTKLPGCGPQPLAVCAWALATYGYCPPDTLEAVAQRAHALLARLTPQQLPMLLWALARLVRSAGGNVSGMACLTLFNSSAPCVVAAAPRMSVQGLAMVAWAYATAQVNPGERALGVLCACALRGVSELEAAPQSLAMIAEALAQFSVRKPALLHALAGAAERRLQLDIAAAGSASAAVPGRQRSDAVWLSSLVTCMARLGALSDERGLVGAAAARALQLARGGHLGVVEAVPLLWGLAGVHGGTSCPPALAAAAVRLVGSAMQRDVAALRLHLAETLRRRVARAGCDGDGADSGSPGGSKRMAARSAAGPAAFSCLDAFRHALPRPEGSDPAAGADAEHRALAPSSNAAAGSTVARGPGRPPGQPELDGGLLAMFLSSCVALRFQPSEDVAQAAALLLLPHLASLSSHTLCELAYAIAMLQPLQTSCGRLPPEFDLELPPWPQAPQERREQQQQQQQQRQAAPAVAAALDPGTALALHLSVAEALHILPPLPTAAAVRARQAALQAAVPQAATLRLAQLSSRRRGTNTATASAVAARGAGSTGGAFASAPAATAGKAAPAPSRQPKRTAPIYQPTDVRGAPTHALALLLRGLLAQLARRLCVTRQDLLSLESTLKLSWAMCALQMYTPRLFKHCTLRALSSAAEALHGKPALLKLLLETRAMVARQRRSVWRRMRMGRAWARRLEAGGAGQFTAAAVVAGQHPAAVEALRAAHASLSWASQELDMPLNWRQTFEGEVYGALHLGRGATAALLPLPPWQVAANSRAPLGGARVSARLLRLRGWCVVAVDVGAWLRLSREDMCWELAELAARLPRAVKRLRHLQNARRRSAGLPPKRHVVVRRRRLQRGGRRRVEEGAGRRKQGQAVAGKGATGRASARGRPGRPRRRTRQAAL